MLKLRVITALILAPAVILSILFLTNIYIKIVFGLILLLAVWEWGSLANLSSIMSRIFYLVLTAIVSIAIDYYHQKINLIDWIIVCSVVWWSVVFVLLLCIRLTNKQQSFNSNFLKLFAGIIVISLAWLSLGDLHQRYPNGNLYLLYVCCLVWVADIGAYFTGKFCGQIRLAPNISPGKTVEGVLGGLGSVLLLSISVFTLSGFLWPTVLMFTVLSLAVALFSVVGDLFESLLKRQAGVKDSGSLLPGHGGVLDRIDSILAALPLFLGGMVWFIDV